MEIGYIPRTLDLQERFFFWEADQFVIGVMIVGLGAATGMMISGLVAGGLAAYAYGKVKSGKHQKFAVHMMYWWLPQPIAIKTQTTPTSDCRYFLG